MSGYCMIWAFWAGCLPDDISLGSWPEWLTMIVTAGALAAAVAAGVYAKRAALATSKQADLAKEAIGHSREQADAAIASVQHSEAAANAARLQVEAAELAYKADAKIREEAQARQVYSLASIQEWVHGSEHTRRGEETLIVYDEGMRGPVETMEFAGEPLVFRRMVQPGLRARVTIRNDSSEVIGPVHLWLQNLITGDLTASGFFPDPVLPASKVEYQVVFPAPAGIDTMVDIPSEHSYGWVAHTEFRDSVGVWWSRRQTDPIVKLDRASDVIPGPPAEVRWLGTS